MGISNRRTFSEGVAMGTGSNTIEATKASVGGDALRIRQELPRLIGQGFESLTAAEKDLLKWVGVFFRRPTPGKFMMRVRMPNGFTSGRKPRAIADVSRRLGNCELDITPRQQIRLRGFELGSVPEIWEKLRGVDLHSLQTGMDNVGNINGCALAGLTHNELFDASLVVAELDATLVGENGNPEFTNLPRKFNATVTGCVQNCTHDESQDVALVPAIRPDRVGFNVLVGGKMGSGGFTIASPLDVFVWIPKAAQLVAALVSIFRDHGPRDARGEDNQPEVAGRQSFSQEILPSNPRGLAGLLVSIIGVRSFAGTHETMSGIVVDHRLKGFACSFHLCRGIGQRGINSCIIARVESINRSLDSGHGILVGRRAIEHKRARKIGTIGREAEGLPTAPAEACYKQLTVRRRKFLGVIGNAIEISGDLIRIEMAHRFRDLILRHVRGASPIGAHSGKQVRGNRHVTGCSHLVGKILDPVRHAKDLVNEKNDRPLVLGLGIHDEGLHRAAIMLHRDPFAMPRRLVQLSASPILGPNCLRE